jgi:flagellar protein FlaF
MPVPNAAAAYAKTSRKLLSPRGIEEKAFQQVTGMLQAVNGIANAPTAKLAEAIHNNTQLWTLLATDAASDANALPPALRAQIISLALYTQKTGRAVLRKEAELDDLIQINRAIMAGLDGARGVQHAVSAVQ